MEEIQIKQQTPLATVHEQKWMALIQERIDSGMTIKDWCRQKGININTYNYWCKRLRKKAFDATQNNQSEQSDPSVNVPVPVEKPVIFAEMPSAKSAKTGFNPAVTVTIRSSQVVISDNASRSTIEAVLQIVSSL